MILTLESTTKLVTLETAAGAVPARIWEGRTGSAIPVHAYITRVAVAEGLEPAAYDDFERELLECAKPSAGIGALPSVLVLADGAPRPVALTTPAARAAIRLQIEQAAERLGGLALRLRDEGWRVTLTIDERVGTVTLSIDGRRLPEAVGGAS